MDFCLKYKRKQKLLSIYLIQLVVLTPMTFHYTVSLSSVGTGKFGSFTKRVEGTLWVNQCQLKWLVKLCECVTHRKVNLTVLDPANDDVRTFHGALG